MYTISDYLHYYKNIPTEEVHWNVMDTLLCSILTYLPLDGYSKEKNLEDFCQYSAQFAHKKEENFMVEPACELLESIRGSRRYSALAISDFQNIRNNDTQFGAATFRLGNLAVISYKGTDDSLIGWLENFRLAYEYPTLTHTLAIRYLLDKASLFDREELIICGHSKGGNLALVAAMEAPEAVWKRIKNVCNFDGPGLRKEEFQQKKFERVAPKLVNIVPSGSVVGVLMHNLEYQVVKSSSYAINEHYPISWNVFGECFIEAKLSSVSKRIHESTTKGLEGLDYQVTKEAIETIFRSFDREYSSDLNLSFEDFRKFYSNMKSLDPEARKSLDIIFDVIWKAGFDLPELRKKIEIGSAGLLGQAEDWIKRKNTEE